MKMIFAILLFVSSISVAQADWERWGKVDVEYYNSEEVKESELQNSSSSILTILKGGYSFLISDLDGDNCPFYPTCSNFFVESVSETNVFQGTLMFVDRFTRDTNLFKLHEHYAVHSSGRLYDPTKNYRLIDSTIIYHSRNRIVE
jgi:putative component of membrane protein insertase Oxa1/YidC/SpoIIIJ protein YidD